MKPNLQLCTAAFLLFLNLAASAAVHYVGLTSPTPTPPYTTWQTAATNIQDAIDAATAGDQILVTNGVYATGGRAVIGTMTNRVVVPDWVELRSENGPNYTFIVGKGVGTGATNDGNGAIRCVYLGSNAILSGFTLTNGHTFSSNANFQIDTIGGGAWCEQSALLTNCILTRNSAYDSGGGIYSGTLNNCTLTLNSSRYNGGGASYCPMNDCILSGNNASSGGGAYYGSLTNCVLNANSSSYEGGGAYQAFLKDCTIKDNQAYYGGGVASCDVNQSTFTGNHAIFGGGAHNASLRSSILHSNLAAFGGGASYGTLTNCTLTGNSAENVTGMPFDLQVQGGGSASAALYNCINYFNTAETGSNYSGGNLYYSCSTPLPPGPGNIDSDPLLASSTRISAQSPCVGRGSSAYADGVDIDGEAWLNPPCMGADQLTTGAVTGPLTIAISADCTNIPPGLIVSFNPAINGRVTASVWDFGDGVLISNQVFNVNRTWSTDGLYQVRLTAYNDTFPEGVSATIQVRVSSTRDAYYVNANNSTPVFPYTNWAGAARTIQDAIDAGQQPGRLVRVTNGVYASGGRAVSGTMTNRVVVPESVEVRSENGPQVTSILGRAAPGSSGNGDGAIRCVYLGSNAVLSGFTLSNGRTKTYRELVDMSGGGACCDPSAVLTNCILTGNGAHYFGAGVYHGTLNNCTLTGNTSGDSGGGAYYATLNNCTLIGNIGRYGAGAFTATLSNCTLTANISSEEGGGSSYGTLYNCTLTGNSCLNHGGGAYYGTLYNCTVRNNSAGNYGGGAYQTILYNCVLAGNSATNYGGGASSGSLYNCTVAGNSAKYGGGVYFGNLYNCIVYYNTANTNGSNYYSTTFNYSCTTPMPSSGSGNLINAPLFFNTNGWANLRLQSNSPCIDSGNYSYAHGLIDLDGEPRILFARIDMGAYEFDGTAHYVDAGNPNPMPPFETWQTAATNIQDAIDTATPGDTVFVNKGTYDTGGRAFYGAMTNRIVINKAINVVSVSGPAMTFLVGQGVGTDGTNNGDGAIRCAYVGTNAVLSGFTLTNGHTIITGDGLKEQSGGGAYCESSGALVNCILTGNTAKGRGGAVYLGFLTNCIVTGNLASLGGGSASATLVNCLLTANAANTFGGAVYNGALYNCTVAGNTSGTFGGGVYSAIITNSIVYYNTASINPNASGGTFAWSCVTPLFSGPGNTTNAPLFQNTNGWTNLHLQFNSPCINSGNLVFTATDLDGNPRLFGAAVDMGAYEHQGVDMGEFMVWLQRYGLPTDGSANEIDSDLDGLNNYQEWRSGTNPTNAASVLRLTQLATNNITLQWQSVSGIRYFLQRSTNLSTPFQPLATNLLGTSNPLTYTDTNPPPSPLYYRLGVEN